MKRIGTILLVSLIFLIAVSSAANALTIDAASAILIDAGTGRVIFQQDEHTPLAPASTTKVLTSLLVLENVADPSQSVTLPDDFVNVGESGIYLEPGETLTYEQLLYALMLRSANDAGQALAIGVSGSEAAFCELMNQKMVDMGLTDSHWSNPHGLDADDHYTSAYDLAMITRQALRYDLFHTIITAESYTLPRTAASVEAEQVIYNHNQFLDRYEGADGVKTGYTTKAGSCLVASATRGDLRLIGVILGGHSTSDDSGSSYYDEMAKLMDYGFDNYSAVVVAKAGTVVGQVTVLNGREKKADVVLSDNVIIPVELGAEYKPEPSYDFPLTIDAPVKAGDVIGTVTYTDSAGNPVSVELYLAASVERYTFGLVFSAIWQSFLGFLL